MSQIKNNEKCSICNGTAEATAPVPCGARICAKHFNSPEDALECSYCNKTHHQSNDNGESDRVDKRNKAKKIYTSLMDKLTQCDQIRDHADLYIYEYCEKEIRKIDILREEEKQKIDDYYNDLIDKIKAYRLEYTNYVESKKDELHLNDICQPLENIRKEINNWNSFLNSLEIDETNLDSIIKEATASEQTTKDILDKLEKIIFMNKKVIFNSSVKDKVNNRTFLGMISFSGNINSMILNYDLNKSSELIKLCGFEPNSEFKLLYRGSRDGFRARDFHSHCDDIPNTLTIIQSENGNIFGGFTTQTWTPYYCMIVDWLL